MITVKYFCHKCMTKKGDKPEISEFVEVSVPTRKEDEDIRHWVEEAARVVGIHHGHRGCAARECDLMIPTTNPEKGIGYE